MTPGVTAVILAEGRGLGEGDSDREVLAPLVDLDGRSLIEIVIRQAIAAGAGNIYVAMGEHGGEIREHVRGLTDLGYGTIEFAVVEHPLASLASLLPLRGTKQTVLVTNGALLSGLDLTAMQRAHHDRMADLTLATHDEHHRLPRGEALTDFEGNLLAYHDRPTKVFRMDSGIYLVEPQLLDLLQDGEALPFASFMERAIEADANMFEFLHTAPLIEVRDVDSLERARKMLRRGLLDVE